MCEGCRTSLDRKAVTEILWAIATSYDYVTHARTCVIGDTKEEEEFNKIRDEGCCGSYETEITLHGVKYRIGFNYGH